MRFVIVVTGLSGSGKSTIVRLLQKRLPGVVATGSSKVIRDELKAAGQKPTEYTTRQHGTARMKEHGPGYWTKRCVEEYLPTNGYLIIDGLRNDGGIHWLKEVGIPCYVIGVKTDFSTCVLRFANRPTRDGEPTMDEPTARAHLTEEATPGPEWGFRLDACMALADAVIDGNQDISNVEHQLEPIIKEIIRMSRQTQKKR